MLGFHYSTAVEFLRVTIAGQPCRVPKAQWSLNTSVTKMTKCLDVLDVIAPRQTCHQRHANKTRMQRSDSSSGEMMWGQDTQLIFESLKGCGGLGVLLPQCCCGHSSGAQHCHSGCCTEQAGSWGTRSPQRGTWGGAALTWREV